MNQRRAFTLLEIIVALALMGSVLVASLLAFSRHRKQLSMAEKRLDATRVADQLVHGLSAQQGGLPIGARGAVAGKDDWVWQTSLVGRTSLATVEMQVVRFEIMELGAASTSLVTVDLVKPAGVP
ncbi:type II secretion system GspH family protein [Stieleria sp. ICT_E10.1]|uniref:type II secretion system protein n=1 Tax=Stieleria sedimenti TaxID=2976331 RepID=UPI0021806C80|nr:type II secretion system protein [Stieleria sedimenti]MCS7465531.1 type II secretion system GspH family protein [Stieleria sedimenti]